MPNVLILGARAPVALDHARRFFHQGWRVIIGDSVSCRMTGWSRSVHAAVRLPSARFAPGAYLQALQEVILAHGIGLVVPTCEEAFFLSHYRKRLPAQVRIPVADAGTMRNLHSKWRFLELARQCGVTVPDSALVTTLAQAREWAAGRPVAIKPEYSRFGVHVRLYPEGIPAKAAPLDGHQGAWVVQRFCRGTELCSYSILDEGRLRAHVAYRPTYRLGGSSSFYFEPRASAPVRDSVEAIGRATGYTGQIAFDWIEAADGQVHALECNPRAVSGAHLFGPDAALPAALAGTGGGCAEPDDAPRMLSSVMLLAGGMQALRAGGAGSWWRDARRARDVIAEAGDRRPVLGGLVDVCLHARTAVTAKCTVREASTRDIEWDGRALEMP